MRGVCGASPPKSITQWCFDASMMSCQCNILTLKCNFAHLYASLLHSYVYPINPQISIVTVYNNFGEVSTIMLPANRALHLRKSQQSLPNLDQWTACHFKTVSYGWAYQLEEIGILDCGESLCPILPMSCLPFQDYLLKESLLSQWGLHPGRPQLWIWQISPPMSPHEHLPCQDLLQINLPDWRALHARTLQQSPTRVNFEWSAISIPSP